MRSAKVTDLFSSDSGAYFFAFLDFDFCFTFYSGSCFAF